MDDVLARLRELQEADLPVHGGRTLAYVYDSGLPDVDRIGREAVIRRMGWTDIGPQQARAIAAVATANLEAMLTAGRAGR